MFFLVGITHPTVREKECLGWAELPSTLNPITATLWSFGGLRRRIYPYSVRKCAFHNLSLQFFCSGHLSIAITCRKLTIIVLSCPHFFQFVFNSTYHSLSAWYERKVNILRNDVR